MTNYYISVCDLLKKFVMSQSIQRIFLLFIRVSCCMLCSLLDNEGLETLVDSRDPRARVGRERYLPPKTNFPYSAE